MGLGGLEPPTSRLSGARSSQLSYRPGSRARALHVPTQKFKEQARLQSSARPLKAGQQVHLTTAGALKPLETTVDLKSTTPSLRSAGRAVRMPKHPPHPRVSLERR